MKDRKKYSLPYNDDVEMEGMNELAKGIYQLKVSDTHYLFLFLLLSVNYII